MRERLSAVEIGVNRQVLEKGVPSPQSKPAGQQPTLSAGVHHEAGEGSPYASVLRLVADTGRSAAIENDLHHTVPLPHVNSGRPAVVQEELVELRAPNLVGVGIPLVCLSEIPAPGCPVLPPDHGGSPLGQKAGLLNGRHHAQLFQDGDAGRK